MKIRRYLSIILLSYIGEFVGEAISIIQMDPWRLDDPMIFLLRLKTQT